MMDTGEDAYIDSLLGEIGSDEITPNDLRKAFLAGASQANAEIARLTHERDVWQGKAKYYGSEVGKAEAELTRLAAENQKFKALIASETAWLRSLQPDTGEQPSPLQAIADILKPFTFKGVVKPDTGETP
jgi:hypothetical protein